MKRAATIARGALAVRLQDVSKAERQKVLVAIERFETKASRKVNTFDMLREGLAGNYLKAEMVHRLSKWCHTEGARAKAIDEAREVSRAMCGLVLPRLVATDNKRVEGYDDLVQGLVRRINRSKQQP